MHPRTLSALAVSSGLIIATGVLAIGSALMPSGASAPPVTPIAAEVPNETATTIVTETQDVYDLAPAQGDDAVSSTSSDAEPAEAPSSDVTSTPATPQDPASSPAPLERDDGHEGGDAHESETEEAPENHHESESSSSSSFESHD